MRNNLVKKNFLAEVKYYHGGTEYNPNTVPGYSTYCGMPYEHKIAVYIPRPRFKEPCLRNLCAKPVVALS